MPRSLCEAGRPFLKDMWPQSLVQLGENTTLCRILKVETTTSSQVHNVRFEVTGSITSSEKPESKSSISTQVKVHGDGWRYFTVVECEEGGQAVCVLFKDHIGHDVAKHAVGPANVLMLASADGLRFGSQPTTFMPHAAQLADSTSERLLTHNLAVLRHAGQLLAVGGLDNKRFMWKTPGGVHTGIYMLHGRLPQPTTDPAGRLSVSPPTWRRVHRILRGWHPGCTEGRYFYYLHKRPKDMNDSHPACEFDGRLSLVHHNGRFWLYARANPATTGQRFVQVTSSVDGQNWSPFELVVIDGYSLTQGDIYFMSVQSIPTSKRSLIALMPMVQHRVGCIAMSCSTDGITWRRPTPLQRCALDSSKERTVHHPASGLLRRGNWVWLYVHENVPGVVESSNLAQGAEVPPSQLRRYEIPVDALTQWTTQMGC